MKRIRLVLHLLGGALLLAACAVASSAQTSAEITGLVRDPTGAAISGAIGARCEAAHTEYGETRQVRPLR